MTADSTALLRLCDVGREAHGAAPLRDACAAASPQQPVPEHLGTVANARPGAVDRAVAIASASRMLVSGHGTFKIRGRASARPVCARL
jgi:hypothetical protein